MVQIKILCQTTNLVIRSSHYPFFLMKLYRFFLQSIIWFIMSPTVRRSICLWTEFCGEEILLTEFFVQILKLISSTHQFLFPFGIPGVFRLMWNSEDSQHKQHSKDNFPAGLSQFIVSKGGTPGMMSLVKNTRWLKVSFSSRQGEFVMSIRFHKREGVPNSVPS